MEQKEPSSPFKSSLKLFVKLLGGGGFRIGSQPAYKLDMPRLNKNLPPNIRGQVEMLLKIIGLWIASQFLLLMI